MSHGQRHGSAIAKAMPAIEPLIRVSQEAVRNGFLENVDEAKRLRFPHIGCTEFMIKFYRDKASPVKYGDEKEKLFPTAARLQAIRRMLEGIRDGAVPARPERVTSAKWSQFKSYVKKDYAIDENGALVRKGEKSGYVIPLEKVHQVLCWAHEQVAHRGRDKTYDYMALYYSVDSLPKDFVNCWTAGCRGHNHREVPEGPNGKTTRAGALAKWEAVRHDTEAPSRRGPDFWPINIPEVKVTIALLGIRQAQGAPADDMGPVPLPQPAMVPADEMRLDEAPLPQPAINPTDIMDPTDADGFRFAPTAMDHAGNMDLDLAGIDYGQFEQKWFEEWEAGQFNGMGLNAGDAEPSTQGEQFPFEQQPEDPFLPFMDFGATNADVGDIFGEFDASPWDHGMTSGESLEGSLSPPSVPQAQPTQDMDPDVAEFTRQLEAGEFNEAQQTINPASLQK